MQTHHSLRIGSLVRWSGNPDKDGDFDDLGIVIYVPEDYADEYYVIHWMAQDQRCDHSPQMMEEKQMEIIHASR